jgi:5-methylcytosine-specific restriction endonuclease McrA
LAKAFVIPRKALFDRYGGRCAYCGKALGRSWHRDHIEPLCRFKGVRYTFSGKNGCANPAAHSLDNIVAACRNCNLDKSNLDLETWRGSLRKRWPPIGVPVVFWFEKYGKEPTK